MSTLWCSGGPLCQKSAFHFCIHSQARGYQSEFCLKKRVKTFDKKAKKVWNKPPPRSDQTCSKNNEAKKKEKKILRSFSETKKHCYSSSSYLCAFPKKIKQKTTQSQNYGFDIPGIKTSFFWSHETRRPGLKIQREFFFIPWDKKKISRFLWCQSYHLLTSSSVHRILQCIFRKNQSRQQTSLNMFKNDNNNNFHPTTNKNP